MYLRENRDHRSRNQHSKQRSCAAKKNCFGKQRASQCAVARAERGAHGQLSLPSHRSGQYQVRDIRNRDDENEGRCSKQHEEHIASARCNLVAKSDSLNPEIAIGGICLRVLTDQVLVYGSQFSASCFEIDAGSEPSEKLLSLPMHSTSDHRGRQMMRTGHNIGDDLRSPRVGN